VKLLMRQLCQLFAAPLPPEYDTVAVSYMKLLLRQLCQLFAAPLPPDYDTVAVS
jgi:hypothetical protein